MVVTDRQDMARALTEQMTNTYELLRDDQRLEYDSSLLKSFVLEASVADPRDSQSARSLFDLVLRETAGRTIAATAHDTEDPTLVRAQAIVDERQMEIFVDIAEPRYWVLHSMAPSGDLGRLIDRWAGHSRLDKAWLPADLLESLSGLGAFRGLGLSYDRRPIDGEAAEDDEETPISFLKVQLWGNQAAAVLDVLRAANAFPGETTLSKVRVRFEMDDPALFTLDDIKFDGKITARGTSFASHLALIDRVLNPYSRAIADIEARFRLNKLGPDSSSVHGEPLFVQLERPIADLDLFCRRVFSGGNPFRLWGVPIRQTGKVVRVSAVDLHVSRPIAFEVSRDFIRVFLSDRSCGNSVMRFYTNLQHYYSSLVSVTGGARERVFDF